MTESAMPRFLNPETIAKPFGYTHVVEATTPGRIVYISGQLGLDRGGKIVGTPGDFEAQCVQTFENMKAVLAAVGLEFQHIVKLNNYLIDMDIFRFSGRCATVSSTPQPRPPARWSQSLGSPSRKRCSRWKRLR